MEIKINLSPGAGQILRELSSNFGRLAVLQEENKRLLNKLLALPSIFETVFPEIESKAQE